jgi:hypothetical protein
MNNIKTSSFQTARNQTDQNASVPDAWNQQFRPVKAQKSFPIPPWAMVVGIPLLSASAIILFERGQLSGSFGSFLVFLALPICSVLGLLLYFLRAICAVSRRHRNRLAICICNFLFGWTFLGWGITLVWSLTNNVES